MRSTNIAIILSITLGSLGVFFMPSQVSAITGNYSNANYPTSMIPAGHSMRQGRPQRCTDGSGTYQNSSQSSWIAVNNGTNFSSTAITVPYGTSSISLVAVHAASTCYNSLYSPNPTGYRFASMTSSGGTSVSGISGGGIHIVNYPDYANRDTHVGVVGLPFTLNLPAGLTGGPYTYNVNMNNEKKINDRRGLIGTPSEFGRFQCVYSGEYVSGFNQASFNACSNETNLSMTITVTVTPEPITVRGRVFRHPSQTSSGGASGVQINTCNGTVTTNASGNFAFTIPRGTAFCVRASGPQPSNTTGAPRVRPWSERYRDTVHDCPGFGVSTAAPVTAAGNNYCNQGSYEWQIAGENRYTGCAINDFCSYDRVSDTGFDLIYREIPPPIIINFSVSCGGGISLTVNVPSGGQWAARLYVDGVNTSPSADGRIPSAGSLNSGQTGTKSVNEFDRWHDIRAHSFYVRVDDQSTGTSTTSATVNIGPCLLLTCDSPPSSLVFNPNPSQPGQPFDMTFTLGFRENFGSNVGVNSVGDAYDPSFAHTVSYSAAPFTPPNDSRAGGNVSRYITRFTGITAQPGTHSGTIRAVVSGGGPTIDCSFGRDGDPPCVALDASGDCDFSGQSTEAQPFFQTFRGDMTAGAPIFESGTCTNYDNGEIRAFNSGSATSYRGSGAQLAIFARSSVLGFISASLRGANPVKPNGLTFANSGGPGNFGRIRTFCSDHFSPYGTGTITSNDAQFNAEANAVAAGGVKVISHSGNLSASGFGSFRGDLEIYVDGNLTITGDMNYAVGGYGSVDSLPHIRFVVKGDIFVQPGVTRLEGEYIAMPLNAATGGNIYTCAPTVNSTPTYSQLTNDCTSAAQLRFFGAVLARRVHLHRLAGTVGDDTGADYLGSTSSEVFIESPFHWLRKSTAGSGSGSVRYESYSSLPPIL